MPTRNKTRNDPATRASRAAARAAPANNRSRIGNGTGLFPSGIDGRTAVARRFRELVADILAEVDGKPTTSQIGLARRAAVLSIWCEDQEGLMVSGRDFDSAEYTTKSNALRRVFEALGLAQTEPKSAASDPLTGFLGIRKAAGT